MGRTAKPAIDSPIPLLQFAFQFNLTSFVCCDYLARNGSNPIALREISPHFDASSKLQF